MRRAILAAAAIGLFRATDANEADAQFSFGYTDKNWGVSVGPSMGYGGGYGGGYSRGYGAYPYGAYPYGIGNYGNTGPRYHVHVPTQSYPSRSGGSYPRPSLPPAPLAPPVRDGLPTNITSPAHAGAAPKYYV